MKYVILLEALDLLKKTGIHGKHILFVTVAELLLLGADSLMNIRVTG